MRVLFFGTAGLDKLEYLNRVANIALQQKFKMQDGHLDSNSKKYLQVFDVDRQIKEKSTIGYFTFLDTKIRTKQKQVWNSEMISAIEKIERDRPQHAFLAIHGVYYRDNNYFTLANWDLLVRYNPTIIVTLIDDIYKVTDRIMKNEKKYKGNSKCTLSESLAWRTNEIMFADTISENLFMSTNSLNIDQKQLEKTPPSIRKLFRPNIPHFVVSIKHNPIMLYRLLFERNRLVLYASYPITDTRLDEAKITEINRFKRKLQEKYTVFDPAAIDEVVLFSKDCLKKRYSLLKAKGMIIKEIRDMVLVKRLHWSDFSRDSEYPESLNMRELISLQNTLGIIMEKRDYRFVDQSNGVVSYRPYWGATENPSMGVNAELIYAFQRDDPKPIYAYHPNVDDVKQVKRFRGIDDAFTFSSLGKLLDHVQKWQKDKLRKSRVPDTWE